MVPLPRVVRYFSPLVSRQNPSTCIHLIATCKFVCSSFERWTSHGIVMDHGKMAADDIDTEKVTTGLIQVLAHAVVSK